MNILIVKHQNQDYTVLPGYIWPASSTDEAVIRSCMAHFVFNTKYAPRHEMIYAIIERLLEIPPEACTEAKQPGVTSLLRFIPEN